MNGFTYIFRILQMNNLYKNSAVPSCNKKIPRHLFAIFTFVILVHFLTNFHDWAQSIPLTASITGSNGNWTMLNPVNKFTGTEY